MSRLVPALAGLLLLACGAAATPVAAVAAPDWGAVPAQLLGYPLQREDIAKALVDNQRTTYFDQVRLYSLRRNDGYLQATLEIGHFRTGSDYGQSYFQQDLVTQVGASEPIPTEMGGRLVYISSEKGLTIASWFGGRYLYILSVRNTFDQPKTLVRAATALRL